MTTKINRYRVIAGKLYLGKGRNKENPTRKPVCYAARDAHGNQRKDSDGKDIPDVVETNKDLIKLFGRYKFIRMHAPVEDGFKNMTVKELVEYAEGEEIELGGATKKDDILSRIRIAIG